ELMEYFRWFIDIVPERIHELETTLSESKPFDSWRPDYFPDSLQMLGDWLATQVKTRSRTSEELQHIAARAAFPIEVAREELTDRTFSLAMDIGMYFGQVLLKNHESLEWDLPLGDKEFVDYGQPVIVGFGDLSLNPVRIVITLAYGIASNRQTGRR